MKQIHTIQRANSPTRQDFCDSNAIKKVIESAPHKTTRNKERHLAIRICGCGRKHWGERDRWCIGKQKEVAKLCPDCFYCKYKTNRPRWFRFLTNNELEAESRRLDVAGVKIYHVDPSTL